MEVKVGDIVTWRGGKSRATGNMPLGIGGCEVLELGVAENGEPAARLRLPEVFARVEREVNGYIADLEPPDAA